MYIFLSREVYETVAILVFLEMVKTPWIKILSELHKAMKEYLIDIEGYSLGDLVNDAVCFAMNNLGDFEEFAGISETEEADTDEEETDQDQENLDDEEGE